MLNTLPSAPSRYDASLPPRSRLFALPPLAPQPSAVESLTSYLMRLAEALALALQEGAKTVTMKHLRQTALAKDKLDLELTAILKGETDFAKAEPKDADRLLLINLGLIAPPKPTRQQEGQFKEAKDQQPARETPPQATQQRLPGEQNPRRLPIGVQEEDKEGGEAEPDEEEAVC